MEAKFANLQGKIEQSLVINVMGVAVTSKDIAAVVDRERPLTAKVVDILVNLIRSNVEKYCALPPGRHAKFFDTRFITALGRAYPKFKKSKNRDNFLFSKGLSFNFTYWKIVVLDCNPSIRSEMALANDLSHVCLMVPYLLKQFGGTSIDMPSGGLMLVSPYHLKIWQRKRRELE
ncbi:hypothetical protein Bca52824_010825 [Brassica carinata]|uniref:Ubiquitin-like protease family profile domain-containing protein n=1 Tax=Brassica carinata TaxID=52824 RepID=A0A8X7WF14_BRACI|nr:hypothetical protein Bca52824_010825 [Brassica carinata]